MCGWLGFDKLAATSFAFAKTCLLPFIKLLLENSLEHVESLSQMLDYFFEGFTSSTAPNSQEIFRNKRAIKKFLHICEYIRIFNNW